NRAVAVVLLERTPQRPEQRDLRRADVDMDGAVAPPRREARIVVGEDRLREELGRLDVEAVLVLGDRRHATVRSPPRLDLAAHHDDRVGTERVRALLEHSREDDALDATGEILDLQRGHALTRGAPSRNEGADVT